MKKKGKEKESLWNSLEKQFGKSWNEESKSAFSDDLPRKWEKHGDLLLLPQKCFTRTEWKDIDEAMLWQAVAEYFKVERVAKKGVICSDGYRTPQIVLLKGSCPWVCHVDNKIRYNYDITKCMFSIGNITEKLRMAKLECKDEVIVDMFAGIGYFTLPLLVHGKAKHVHACEWNPDAVFALRKNLEDNKVADRCTVYEGDNRELCPQGVADRVLMGLIPTPMGSLAAACRALRRDKGGLMHIHSNVESKFAVKKDDHSSLVSCNKKNIPREWVSWAHKTASAAGGQMRDVLRENGDAERRITTKIAHIERVKSYAPHIDHLVLDLNVSLIS